MSDLKITLGHMYLTEKDMVVTIVHRFDDTSDKPGVFMGVNGKHYREDGSVVVDPNSADASPVDPIVAEYVAPCAPEVVDTPAEDMVIPESPEVKIVPDKDIPDTNN